MNLRFVVCAAAMGLAAASAGAQSMKPGLWETTTRMGGSPEMDQAMARMQQQMASMPPGQRKQMQTTMDTSGKWLGDDCGTIKPFVFSGK